VCDRNPSLLNCPRQQLCIDAIRFAAMMADSDLLGPRRVDEQDVVTPLRQNVVNMPCFAARLDRHSGAFGAWTEYIFQVLHLPDGSSSDDETTENLAERCLLHAEVQGYTSHGHLLLDPR
jgi:hypothetical protein